MSYYEDLSGASSSGLEDDDDDDKEEESLGQKQQLHQQVDRDVIDGVGPDHDDNHDDTSGRIILHVDVDCFYCQCEMLDRQLSSDTPIAIGQKHIIVTSNYAARAQGVGKLQSKTRALQACPELQILPGSDLQQYRQHAHAIYASFRRACQDVYQAAAVCKGSMDEMTADLTGAVEATPLTVRLEQLKGLYVYGNNNTATSHNRQEKETVVLTEDQTGATVTVQQNAHQQCGAIPSRLLQTAALALQIRNRILTETGFCVTMGISTNPLLAKLASGLRKPALVNLLVASRAADFLPQMPLRKIHGLGRSILKALQPALLEQREACSPSAQQEPQQEDASFFWTVGDLLKVPLHRVTECLKGMQSGGDNASQLARDILEKCRGEDSTLVIDDNGGMSKTLSVEDSFRRGTVVTLENVRRELATLCRRLPVLLRDRQSWSDAPTKAYGTTVRVTVRTVCPIKQQQQTASAGRKPRYRRPYVTHSKQSPVDGPALLTSKAERVLYDTGLPLLTALLETKTVDVTRLNLALTHFQDVGVAPPGVDGGQSSARQYTTAKAFFAPHLKSDPTTASPAAAPGTVAQGISRSPASDMQGISRRARSSPASPTASWQSNPTFVDPAVLSELPPEIAAEFAPLEKKQRSRLDYFFSKKPHAKA